MYDSIKAPGLLPPGALEHFDAEGEYLLYELRFLSIAQRAPAAAYIAQHNLRCAAAGAMRGAGLLGRAGRAGAQPLQPQSLHIPENV